MRIHFYRPAALLGVTGEDSGGFLQGQFTNELRQPSGSVVYGLWLNQKGKVLADSHVLKFAENEYRLVSITSPAEDIRQRLEEYIVADDVSLADETAQACGLAVSGPRCGEVIGQIFGPAPLPGRFTRSGVVLIFAGRQIRGENYELIGPEDAIADLRQKFLATGAGEAAADEMEFVRMADGIPAIPWDIGPGDLPNEGGLEDVAISYTKGCYLGQEIMARLKNMGQIRRRLHVIRGTGAAPVRLAPLFQAGKKVGQVRSAATAGNEFRALAMLSLVQFDPALGLSLEPEAAPGVEILSHG